MDDQTQSGRTEDIGPEGFDPTVKVNTPSSRSSSSIDHGRFTPGEVVADRYRILGRLGIGGMGEVYKADDLTLGLQVALKFLPPHLSEDPRRLEEVRNEVRVARQVAHPHVCRVYDIGECMSSTGREVFISMEYVDGEDLASLLRRIGRLPTDKAVEIARQLCAGLGAAHALSVLHRDLKPANLMLDGQGRLRVMDFGLAAVAEQIVGQDARAGTPAYMAPEQLEGKEVSVRSDVFALGLVLYELFTGRRAFQSSSLSELKRLQTESRPPSASTIVADIDQTVERVIERCLELDPADRPASVHEVAAALPGGDPLAAALAAGETPSPEMVAASVPDGTIHPAIACGLFLLSVLSVVALMLAASHAVIARVPLPRSPRVLEDRAREVVALAGVTERPSSTAHGLSTVDEPLEAIGDDETRDWDELEAGWPSPVRYWYRQSPDRMQGRNAFRRVVRDDPPFTRPGMVRVGLDSEGRLLEFVRVPPRFDPESDGEGVAEPVDWEAFFDRSGLEYASFDATESIRTPSTFAHDRFAWTGPDPVVPDQMLRIEAATWHGSPVAFKVLFPWDLPRDGSDADRVGAAWGNAVGLSVLIVLIGVGGVLAHQNVTAGRGDRRGARRLGIITVLTMSIGFELLAGHNGDVGDEWNLFAMVLGLGLFLGGMAWVLYLALEPYLRRVLPHLIVSWVRLLSGRWRDPLVGRDILIGMSAGLLLAAFQRTPPVFAQLAGHGSVEPPLPPPDVLAGGAPLLAMLSTNFSNAILKGALVLLGYLLLRAIVRFSIIANTILVGLIALTTLDNAVDFNLPVPTAITIVGGTIVFSLAVLRFGLLATVACIFFADLARQLPLTTEVGSWYGQSTVVFLATALIVGGWSFYNATRGRLGMGEWLMRG